LDKELLLNIFKIPAPSNEESQMAEFIKKTLDDYNIDYTQDSKGNVYNISNQNIPILSAHMDTVQDSIDAKLTAFIRIRGDILSGYGVIGADDKCGIYIILNLLKERKLNFVFSVGEEIGAHGIKHFIKHNDLLHVPYGIILDRRGNNDIICEKNEYGTKLFENALLEIGKVFTYSTNIGTFSDADFLNEKISCANLSVGYYNAHTKNEFVQLSDLQRAEHFVRSIVKNLKEKFKKPKKNGYGGMYGMYGNYGIDEWDDNDEEEYACVFCKNYSETFYLRKLKKYCCKKCAGIFLEDVSGMDINNDFFLANEIKELDDEYYERVKEY